ncbi:hypothetical protein [Aquimarina sp. LLG6339-5]|uniref:hypothetical protein n=1 Tax=Aquimarina sp. LLG6339-5 TaxID=3160830 RepID=UPI00386B637F
MTTKFSEKFKEKNDSDLFQIIENPSSYQKEAVLTAILELESRELGAEKMTDLKSKVQNQINLNEQQTNKLNESKIPSDLPNSISKSAKLIYVSIALGIINPIIVQLTTEVDNFGNPLNLAIILISTGTLAFLGYNINLGKNWARIVFSILCGLGFLMFPLVIPETFRLNPIVGIISAIQAVLQLLAIILLFKIDSRTWYRNEKAERKNTVHNNV